MLEVFKRDEFNGKLKIIAEFDSIEDLVRHVPYNFDFAVQFGYHDVDRHTAGAGLGDHHPPCNWAWWPDRNYCYVAYDNGKFVTPDRLVGAHRVRKAERRSYWHGWSRQYDRGKKKSAHGWIRHMHTMHERRWQNAWDDEEFCPPYRACRRGNNLPSNWDDIWVDSNKCWKKQSKRKHQWKEKKWT